MRVIPNWLGCNIFILNWVVISFQNGLLDRWKKSCTWIFPLKIKSKSFNFFSIISNQKHLNPCNIQGVAEALHMCYFQTTIFIIIIHKGTFTFVHLYYPSPLSIEILQINVMFLHLHTFKSVVFFLRLFCWKFRS